MVKHTQHYSPEACSSEQLICQERHYARGCSWYLCLCERSIVFQEGVNLHASRAGKVEKRGGFNERIYLLEVEAD